jgi:hypothetical protein
MSLNDDQPGTWSVDYLWGVPPPPLGSQAAAQLACQIYLQCVGDADNCVLPLGASRVTRQGVEIDRNIIFQWLDPTKSTGIVLVDLFLAAYCRNKAKMRSAVYSPDVQAYSRPFANTAGDAACTSTLGDDDFGV